MPLLSPSRVVDSLISARLLDPAARSQALAVLATLDAAPPAPLSTPPAPSPRRSSLASLVEVVAYLGGALVLGAATLFLAENWSDLSFGSQVTGLAVAFVCLGAAGTLVGLRERAVTSTAVRRLASTLLTGAALVAGGWAGLVVDHSGGTPSDGSTNWTWLAVCVAVLLVVVPGRRVAASAFSTIVLFAALCQVVDAALSSYQPAGLVIAGAWLPLALVWLAFAERWEVADRTLRRVLGVGLAMYAAQTPLFYSFLGKDHTVIAYLLTSVVVAAAVAAYLRLRAWPYLAGAVIGVTIVVPEAVTDWTGGDLGATGAVLLTGLTLLAASLAGTRLLRTRVA